MDWQATFETGMGYGGFLAQHGTAGHRDRWGAVYEQTTLDGAAMGLLEGFVRQMNVFCLTGAWCGDCVNQCPVLQRIAEASDRIDLRFADRDVSAELREAQHQLHSLEFGQPFLRHCRQQGFVNAADARWAGRAQQLLRQMPIRAHRPFAVPAALVKIFRQKNHHRHPMPTVDAQRLPQFRRHVPIRETQIDPIARLRDPL